MSKQNVVSIETDKSYDENMSYFTFFCIYVWGHHSPLVRALDS